ncbi:MAG: aminotransferase class I/II-fold pyridoxal phosphate-dependent enzyme [Mogibacterium sp.]|nr:aminotransferase class I/II-fold pyridoxal phosphate-dependent enzyme [Mogibacterium sp.]
MSFVKENNRTIPKEDKVFAVSGRAKAAIAAKGKDAVVDATIGALLDDKGDLVVMTSVMEAIGMLKPADYAAYAPIAGVPEFKEAVQKALFADYKPARHIAVCATPGGTGSLTHAVANYTNRGDEILTHDWCWANYKGIADEHGRSVKTFRFFDEEGKFDSADLKSKLDELAAKQEQVLLMINTPAHNPTGYSLTDEDWDNVINIVNAASCKVVLFVDIAYIDFAGEPDEVRAFIPKLEGLGTHVLTLFGYSASKTLTAYGMRCGATVCLAKTAEEAEEFTKAVGYTSRSTWSNCNRSAQVVMGKIYSDDALCAKVDEERKLYRDMLLERGKAFEQTLRENGVKSVPFTAGFFITIPSDKPDEICKKLEEQDIFCLALAKGIRVSIASISKDNCLKCAKAIAELLK